MLIQGPILDQLLVSDESGPPSVFIHIPPSHSLVQPVF